MIAWLNAHPDATAAIVLAVLVHLRTLCPAPKPNSVYALTLQIWDILAGNYGKAKNKE